MKAIALISGGLDSTLAAKFMQNLGIELVCLNTVSPFCLCNRRSSSGCMHGANQVAKQLNLKLVSVDVSEEFLRVVKKPEHGYGSNMNPCIDCRILLFRKAKELMQREGASFVITGEVLGQRPMSQRIAAMHLIDREAGLKGLVLRPLSAKVLEPTLAETEGWVSREKLMAINGRGRKEQISLAAQFGIKDYPCPSGGCLLTDPAFCRRLKELMRFDVLSLDNVRLLKLGRHFRLSPGAKLVVGRNEEENQRLLNLAGGNDYIFTPQSDVAGPTCIGRGDFNPDLLGLACRIAGRYCDINGNLNVSITYRRFSERQEQVAEIEPLGQTDIAGLMV